MLNKEFLSHILKDAKENFKELQNQNKLITCYSNGSYRDYNVIVENDFLEIIKNRFNTIIDDLDLTDEEIIEELENLDYETIFNEEFDGEWSSLIPYYEPKKEIQEEEYKYAYLIFYHAGAENKDYLKSIVYSNKEINSIYEMSEVLENNNIAIPSEFDEEWANHYIRDLEKIDDEDLYDIIDYERFWLENVDIVFIEDCQK